MATPHIDDAHIAQAAYFMWLEEGRPEGRDCDHWLRAAAALTPVKAAKKPRAKAAAPKKAAAKAPAARAKAAKPRKKKADA